MQNEIHQSTCSWHLDELHPAIIPNAWAERCCADDCTMNAAIWWRFIDQSLQIAFIDPREVQLSCDVALRRQRGTRLLKKFDSSRGNVTDLWFWFRSEPETSCFGDVALRKTVWLLYSEFALLKIQLDYGKADMAVEASICHSKADLTVENQIW